MKLRYLIFTMLFTARWAAMPALGAVQLSSLNNPNLQTLISMGSTPVAVGPYLFSDFTFVDASSTTRTASQVLVMSFANDGSGLQFVTNWFAADGSMVDDVISYDVQTVNPLQPIGKIDLLTNGTAPVPVAGTFTSSSLIAQVPGGATASPVLSTYNDGYTTPIDTTKPDVNFVSSSLFPQNQLHITDSLIEISTPGGLTTASVLQNTFVQVPEPKRIGWNLLLPLGLLGILGRPRRQGPRLN